MQARAERGRTTHVVGFGSDEAATLAAAVLPMLFGSLGLVFVATGAFTGLTPLLLVGAGLCVVGFASFMVAEHVRRGSDRRRARVAEEKMRRKMEAEADLAAWKDAEAEAGIRPLPPRSPLADAAVEALSGKSEASGPQPGQVWPPLPSQQGRSAEQAMASTTADHWMPGRSVGPAAFHDRSNVTEEGPGGEIVFETVGPVAATHVNRGTMAVAAPAPRDFRVWPGSESLGGWERFSGGDKPVNGRADPKLVAARMKERRARMAEGLPVIGAIMSEEGTKPKNAFEGKTRGKCSKCESVIWAPNQRPIVLKCPGCGHKAKLY